MGAICCRIHEWDAINGRSMLELTILISSTNIRVSGVNCHDASIHEVCDGLTVIEIWLD